MVENALASTQPPELTLVMPVLNDGPRVIPAICTLAFTVQVPLTLLVVYDREEDTTLPVLEGLREVFPSIRLVRNRGKRVIGAIRTGFGECKTEVVGIWVPYHVDPHGLVNKMYALVRDHDCQLVSGNRFNRIRRVSRGTPLKKLLSRGGNWLLNRVIGVPLGDITTSLKLYRRSFIERHPLKTEDTGGWALSTEFAVKAAERGYKMGEVEFLPENVNMILGVSNFQVLGQLGQYLKWLLWGLRRRKVIRANYRVAENFVRI